MSSYWGGGWGEVLLGLSAGSLQVVWSNGHSNMVGNQMLVLEASVPWRPALWAKGAAERSRVSPASDRAPSFANTWGDR